jgi:cytochrome c biogenesis protein CcmG/thiol:disulfide interchange protein DsbE
MWVARVALLAVSMAALGATDPDETCTVSVPLGASLEWKHRAGKPGQLKVRKVEKASGAASMGYRAGDEILSIGGESVVDKDLRAVLDLSRAGGRFRTRRNQEELLLEPLFLARKVLESCEHGLKPGDRAPGIPAFLRRGVGDALDALEGRVVLVSFWAVWCEPCLSEMPVLGRLQAKYGGRGLSVVALNVDDEIPRARRYLAENPPQFGVVVTGGMTSRPATSYRVEGIPLNVLVDRRRRIAQVRVGYAEGQQEAWLSAGIEALLDADDSPVLVVRKE